MFKSIQLYSTVQNITRKLLNNGIKSTQRDLIVGGAEIVSGIYQYNVFIANSSLRVTEPVTVDVLLVGGGGAGGAGNPGSGGGGGGGAGGVLYGSLTLSAGTYPIVVGTGGVGVAGFTGGTGGNTVGFGYTAFGGGGGGDGNPADPGIPGGSGGGGGSDNSAKLGGTGTQTPFGPLTGYGYDGMYGENSGDQGGGGGGAGGPVASPSMNGANGRPFSIFPAPVIEPAIPAPVRPRWTPAVGTAGTFAGGGAGGGAGGPYSGGTGGGGIGKGPLTPQPQYDIDGPGVDYTGSGGGGHARIAAVAGKDGGNGIVIIRHIITPP
jgi:hypothetical protein